MKTTLKDQIEKMNSEIRKTRELLKLFINGEDYYKMKVKKLKIELNQEKMENLSEEKLQRRLDDLLKQIDTLKKSRPMITIYNDGSNTKISLEEIQLFVFSSFRMNLHPRFGMIKNTDKLDRVSVFVIEDNRLGGLIMKKFEEEFDHQIYFESEEGWIQSLMNVRLNKYMKDSEKIETSKLIKENKSSQIGIDNVYQHSLNPTLSYQEFQKDNQLNAFQSINKIKINQTQLYESKTLNLETISNKQINTCIKSNSTNSVKKVLSQDQKITRKDLLLSFRQLIKEHYPLPIENSSIMRTTKKVYKPVNENSPMFAIDCEMCKTEQDELVVTRISLIDEAINVLMDEYVKPKEKIIDYLTQFSGIKPENLANVTTTLEDIHQRLDKLLPQDAILVGHSLNCDLQSLKLSHPYIIDTSCIYNFSIYFNSKPSLKQLSIYYLKNSIQDNENGHCSIEDAKATMQLVQLKLSKNLTFGDNRLSRQLGYTNKPILTLAEFFKFNDQSDVKIVYDYLELESFPRFISITSKHMNKIIDKIAWASKQLNSICIVILNGTCLIKIL